MTDFLTLDGSYGEGGGQILRTALSLSSLTTRPIHLVRIRAGRRNPGLLPQHLAAARAAATICGATLSGDQLGASELSFAPSHPPKAGAYVFDVATAAERGSAGSVTLILQTLLIPLAFAREASNVTLRGGTHVEWSPPFDHLMTSYLPALRRMGFSVEAELTRWGWYPIGGGEIVCRIAAGSDGDAWPRPIEVNVRGRLQRIAGRAVAANLPAHIPQRMVDQARAALVGIGVPVDIQPQRVTAACPGAAIFLVAEYEGITASFSAYGRLGKPSEVVADEAVAALREHHASGAAIELHLADQLLVPLALAAGPSSFTIAHPTRHLSTNAWAIGQFDLADVLIEEGTPCRVRVEPRRMR